MDVANSQTLKRYIFWSAIILSLIIIYPNIGGMLWSIFSPPGTPHYREIPLISYLYFGYRYFYFVILTSGIIWFNIKYGDRNLHFKLWRSFGIAAAGYLVYVLLGSNLTYWERMEVFTKEVILQFIIAWVIPVLIGYIYTLILNNQKVQKEIEVLRTENLQSKVDALTNQINPHFFFNSLNGLTALASAKRNEETVEYIAKLSNIFRYILQSDKKGLVTLEEELIFLDAYRYLIEVRYSGKICFVMDVEENKKELQLPVLSLLPLIENIIKHNIIDSDHKMEVHISLTENEELVVSNPVSRKYLVETSHGIGLSNLSARYKLLMGTDIRIIEENATFSIVLPLKKTEDESADSRR